MQTIFAYALDGISVSLLQPRTAKQLRSSEARMRCDVGQLIAAIKLSLLFAPFVLQLD